MTTIAFNYKDKEIAVDSRESAGNRIVNDKCNKVLIRNGVKFIICGASADREMFIDYYFSENKTDLVPECTGMAIDKGVGYYVTVNGDGVSCRQEMVCNETMGSGGDFALAAMDFGCSARDAVKYAMKRDSRTGGKIRVIKVA